MDKQIGAAYVFRRETDAWVLEQKLSPMDGRLERKLFGTSVAIQDTQLVCGAYAAESTTGVFGGAVYVFRRIDTVWEQEAKLTPLEVEDGDAFGSAVAMGGDSIFVAAPGNDAACPGDPEI